MPSWATSLNIFVLILNALLDEFDDDNYIIVEFVVFVYIVDDDGFILVLSIRLVRGDHCEYRVIVAVNALGLIAS